MTDADLPLLMASVGASGLNLQAAAINEKQWLQEIAFFQKAPLISRSS